jgi:hypothetical protein
MAIFVFLLYHAFGRSRLCLCGGLAAAVAAFSRQRVAASLIFGESGLDVKQKRNKSGVTDFHFIDKSLACGSGGLRSAVRNGRFETHLNAASRSLGTPRRDRICTPLWHASARRVEKFRDGAFWF